VGALVVAACFTREGPTVVPADLTPPPTVAATALPTASPEPSLDANGLPPTTTTGWWGDPDGGDCAVVGHYRIGYRVAQIGNCQGMFTEGTPELTLDVGEDFDLHMTIPADGAKPIWSLPEAEDRLIVRGWLAFDDATWTYRALSGGTTRLVSASPCDRDTKETPSATNGCPILVIHVRPISTKCVGLAEDVCREIGAQAMLGGWDWHPGQRITGWVVRPDSFIGGADCGDGVARVTLTLKDPDEEYDIQVGNLQPSPSGPPRYVVCTY
jgi:hypothetical protein